VNMTREIHVQVERRSSGDTNTKAGSERGNGRAGSGRVEEDM